ncbi:WD40 repeat domain 95, partial [Rhizophlyctis rosea]
MPAQTISLPSISNTRSTVANAPNRADKGASLAQKARLYSHAQQLLADARSGQVELKSRLDDATVSKKINVLKDPAAYRSEREMNLAHFRELLRVFQSAAVDKDGKMDVTQFKSVFSVVLGTGLTDEQMDVLFMKIDANTDDAIDWDEFSTFMLLRAEGQTAMREAAETRLFNADTMTKIVTPHRETINKILYLSGHKRFMTCSRDGTVCYWSDKMKLQRSYKNIGARRPQSPNKKKGFSPAPPKVFGQPHQRWVHDCIYMEDTSKVVMSSDDHEVTIYDYTTMETQIRLDLHDTVALSLDSYHDPENPESDQTTLILGTDSGHILFFTFSPLLLFSATGKKKDDPPPLINLTSARSLKTFGATLWKRKSHNDWTLKVQYFADLKSVVSCSPDSRNSFCMGTEVGKGKWSFVTASVYRGVNTFAFCKFPICLVTGGTDRQIRLWNPYRLSNPMAALRGHSSPITDITINPINGQIISLSVDKQIRIWDIRKQQCLQTLFDHVEHKPEDVLTRVFFSKVHARLIAASTIMETYKLRDPPARGAEVPRTRGGGEV